MTTETFDIVLNYDTSKATASLGSFRAEALRGLQELASKAAKLDILSGLTEESKKSGEALAELKTKAD